MSKNHADATNSTGLWAGAAVVDITPQNRSFLYGYPHVARYSTGVHDPLECAVLFLRNKDSSALFLANDVICFEKRFVADLRRRLHTETGVPAEAILVSATHTHSGPVMTNYMSNAADPMVPKADQSYLKWLADRMVEAGCAAVKAAVPAEIGLAVARAEGVGTNRHDPAGPTDSAVPLLLARSRDKHTPIGCMVVYGMHPTVLHEDSTLFSADFPYFTRRFLREKALTPTCPVIYHNGASGNQSPRHVTHANTFAEAQRLGEKLGQALVDVIPTISFRSEAPIQSRQSLLDLQMREFPKVHDAEQRLQQVRARFEQLKQSGAARQTVRTAECDVFGAEETAELARFAADGRLQAAARNCLPAEIQAIEIGPWKFVAWPGEFFAEYALAVKARSPETFVITLANGELQGYIVTAEAAAQGGYESANAVFSSSNGPRFVEATLALINARQ